MNRSVSSNLRGSFCEIFISFLRVAYSLGNFHPFSIFFLYLFTMGLTMKAWFRALAASMKSEATAQAVAGLSVLVLVLYTGYAIPQVSNLRKCLFFRTRIITMLFSLP